MRFDVREVARGAGDHWVAGGALAISALAGAKLIDAADSGMRLWNDDDSAVMRHATVALLAVALATWAVLAGCEVVWPRLRYDARRWSTVFPLGMTAAATLSVAAALDVAWLEGPGQALVWITVAVWSAVAVGAGASMWAEYHGTSTQRPGDTGSGDGEWCVPGPSPRSPVVGVPVRQCLRRHGVARRAGGAGVGLCPMAGPRPVFS